MYNKLRSVTFIFFQSERKRFIGQLSVIFSGGKAPSGVTEVSFGSLRRHIKTGDIVLFSGVSTSGSIIKFFTHSNYSHIAIVSEIIFLSPLYNFDFFWPVPCTPTQAICPKFTTEVFVLETTPNHRGELLIVFVSSILIYDELFESIQLKEQIK